LAVRSGVSKAPKSVSHDYFWMAQPVSPDPLPPLLAWHDLFPRRSLRLSASRVVEEKEGEGQSECSEDHQGTDDDEATKERELYDS